jgi:superfamily II DNA or RNA helicase
LHGKLLDRIDKLFVLSGRVSKKKQKEVMDELNSISGHENILLMATVRYIGEGFDYPRLDTLLLTFPISWSGNLEQYVGRLNREYRGKKNVAVLDYFDIHVPVLNKMHQKTLRGYKKLDYKVKSNFDVDCFCSRDLTKSCA